MAPRIGDAAVRKRVQQGSTETVFKNDAHHALDELETVIGSGNEVRANLISRSR